MATEKARKDERKGEREMEARKKKGRAKESKGMKEAAKKKRRHEKE